MEAWTGAGSRHPMREGRNNDHVIPMTFTQMLLAYGDPAHTVGVGYSVWEYSRPPGLSAGSIYDACAFFKRILNEGIPVI